jgi:hypothetical protein
MWPVNPFDAQPYASLLPRTVVRVVGTALLLVVLLVPSVRGWLVDQAQQHYINRMQPLLEDLLDAPTPEPPVSPRPDRNLDRKPDEETKSAQR